MKKSRILRQCIVLSIIFCSIIFSISSANADEDRIKTIGTYYWDRSNGVSVAGYITNWTTCSSSSPQVGFKITSLRGSVSSCSNGQLTRSDAGDLFLAIFPTAYSSDMQIIGRPDARFYLRGNSGSATYMFELGYVQTGTFTSLGNVIRTGISTSGSTYTIDMSTINGIAPAGSNLALKVLVTTSSGGRIYLGQNGGTKNSNSGRFYVNETVVPPLNIVAPANITTGTTGTYTPVDLGLPTVTGGTPPYTITNDSPTGGFPNGTTTVTWNVTDVGGMDTDIQLVTITQPPPPPPQTGSPNIVVRVNRPVVLDDPNTGTISSGFSNPSNGNIWNSDLWGGESTTIRTTALIVNNDGIPQPGISVTFNLKNPAGTIISDATITTPTDNQGIAYYSYNINAKNYWGNWTVDAIATVGGSNKQNSGTFVSNWWGCALCHNNKVTGSLVQEFGSYSPKSYYTMGANFHANPLTSAHRNRMTGGDCTYCHQSYNGRPTHSSTTPQYSPDWHNGKVRCEDCHSGSNISNTRAEIAGCYDTAGCHANKNANVSIVNSTTGYVVGGNYRTNYSKVPDNIAKAHTDPGNPGITCILCHSAGHNITKPSNVLSTSNAFTENEQCWTCHTDRTTTHKSNTNCAGCHSQDAHNISTGAGGPDCISCHDINGMSSKKVNVGLLNSTVHKNLNFDASIVGVREDNRICWGCHQTGGIQPNGHPDKMTNPYKCIDCHGRNSDTQPSHVGTGVSYSASKTSQEITDGYGLGDAPTGQNMTHMRDTTISYNWLFKSPNNQEEYMFSRHSDPNQPGRYPGTYDGGPRDQNRVCISCHSKKIRDEGQFKENNWNTYAYCGGGAGCHDLWRKYDIYPLPTSHEISITKCTDCHSQLVKFTSAAHNTDPEFLQPPDNYLKIVFVGDNNIDVSAHARLVNNTPTGIPTNNSGCIICHTDANYTINYSKNPIEITINNDSKSHLWNSDPYCTNCHKLSGGGKGPDPTNHISFNIVEKDNSRCYDCHSPTQRYGHSVSALTSGGADCKSCHDTGGMAPKHVNFSDANSTGAVHKNLNSGASATVNVENKKCWSCHGDGTQPASGHPSNYTTPKKCTDCHLSGVPKVDNHILNGVNNGVNISTNVSCENCHNNSIIRFESTVNASSSHYGTKTNLADTKDCIYCHKNPVNGNIWGGATDPYNSPTFPHSLTTTTKEECYSCHGNISAGAMSFHNIILSKPPLSSVSCLDCHRLGINMSATKIDSSVSSTAVHKDKNCLDCHAGATTGNMNTYSVMTSPPVNCTICHASLEHQPSAPDVQTTISCKNCHNNNGMYNNNAGTNGTENAVVHYLKNVTDTTTTPYGHTGTIDTSNCMICHGNGSLYTGDPNWGSPVNISNSTRRIHTETTIAQCNGCHKDNTVATLENVDFHNASLTAGAGGDNCLGCHAGAE